MKLRFVERSRRLSGYEGMNPYPSVMVRVLQFHEEDHDGPFSVPSNGWQDVPVFDEESGEEIK